MNTKRLALEPLTKAHAPEMFASLSDPEIYSFIDETPPDSMQALAERYARLETRLSGDGQERWLNWVVRETATATAVGFVQASVKEGGTASVAFVIAPTAQRRGFAGEATAAMIDELRAVYGASRLRASVDPRNAASIALLLSLGFREKSEKHNGDRIFELHAG